MPREPGCAPIVLATAHTARQRSPAAARWRGRSHVDFRARNYDSGTGRFTREDPLLILSSLRINGDLRNFSTAASRWNLYLFVNGNPLRFLDPYGLQACISDCQKQCLESQVAQQVIAQAFALCELGCLAIAIGGGAVLGGLPGAVAGAGAGAIGCTFLCGPLAAGQAAEATKQCYNDCVANTCKKCEED